jgi:hypothetical protein
MPTGILRECGIPLEFCKDAKNATLPLTTPARNWTPAGGGLTALGGFAGLKKLLAELDVPPATEQGQPG